MHFVVFAGIIRLDVDNAFADAGRTNARSRIIRDFAEGRSTVGGGKSDAAGVGISFFGSDGAGQGAGVFHQRNMSLCAAALIVFGKRIG